MKQFITYFIINWIKLKASILTLWYSEWRLTSFNDWWMLRLVWQLAHKVRPRPIPVTALAQCARASDVQALHHGAQLPVRSSATVIGRPLPISLRRRFSAASQVRQLTTTSTSPVANVWPMGFLCCWPIGLELTAWQFERSECHQTSADFWKHICSLSTEASSALEVLRRCAIQIYYLLTY